MKKTMALMALLLPAGSAWAVGSGAYAVQSLDAKSMGMGNAVTATADEPSTLFFNPAGLALLPGTQFSVGVSPILAKSSFEHSTGEQESTKNDWLAIPNFYATHQLADNLGLGFGVFTAYGLETHWPNTGTIQYLATDSRLQSLEFSLGLGYRPTPLVALGASALYTRMDAKMQNMTTITPIDEYGNPLPDVILQQTLKGDGTALGYSGGILLNPEGKHRLGLSYRSAFHVTVEGNTKLEGAIAYETGTKTRVILPDSFTLGGAIEPNDRWLVSADLEWVGWGRIEKSEFYSEDGTSLPLPRDWKSTWNLGVGSRYKLNKTWESRAGYLYFPQVVPEATWEPSTPDSAVHGLTLGLGMNWGQTKVDLGYNYFLYVDRTIRNDFLNGTAKTDAHMLALSFTYRIP